MTVGTPPHSSSELSSDLRDAIADSRKRFIASVGAVRPRLHRFCARMSGSVLDGEDIVQETLTDAFYNLASLRDPVRFESWLFRIAYFKCVDFVRRESRAGDRGLSVVALEEDHATSESDDAFALDAPIDAALLTLVGHLPPKERATVLLKDVLDYSLNEVAVIIDSTLNGVKAALHRARIKLASRAATPTVTALDDGGRRLFEAYADCFNRRDWEALKDLVRADARLEIVGEKIGTMSDLGTTYSGNYLRLPYAWRLSVGDVDGELAIVHWRLADDVWRPHSAARLAVVDGKVGGIRDYIHVDYLLRDASIETVLHDDR
jgi:RNA polymerase sigma-70 factor (ECF subfamily)